MDHKNPRAPMIVLEFADFLSIRHSSVLALAFQTHRVRSSRQALLAVNRRV